MDQLKISPDEIQTKAMYRHQWQDTVGAIYSDHVEPTPWVDTKLDQVIVNPAPSYRERITEPRIYLAWRRHSAIHQGGAGSSTEGLRQRLANANSYFHRKASEVLADDAALKLLAALYQDVVVEISEFDVCKNGISLAKLTAANFAEIGGNVIYITEAGQRFIDSIKDS